MARWAFRLPIPSSEYDRALHSLVQSSQHHQRRGIKQIIGIVTAADKSAIGGHVLPIHNQFGSGAISNGIVAVHEHLVSLAEIAPLSTSRFRCCLFASTLFVRLLQPSRSTVNPMLHNLRRWRHAMECTENGFAETGPETHSFKQCLQLTEQP